MADIQRGSAELDEMCLEWLNARKLGYAYDGIDHWTINKNLAPFTREHLNYMVHESCEDLYAVGMAKPDGGEWMKHCISLRDWVIERGMLQL